MIGVHGHDLERRPFHDAFEMNLEGTCGVDDRRYVGHINDARIPETGVKKWANAVAVASLDSSWGVAVRMDRTTQVPLIDGSADATFVSRNSDNVLGRLNGTL
jgi:hypothetical protein